MNEYTNGGRMIEGGRKDRKRRKESNQIKKIMNVRK